MDPELRAYLDRLDSNANDRAAAADAKYDSIIERLDAQTARIDSLADWKRELEARFAKLELSVASLQAASTTPASSKGPPSAFPTAAAGDTPGQSSHGVPLHPGGIPSVTLASPVPSPGVKGTGSLRTCSSGALKSHYLKTGKTRHRTCIAGASRSHWPSGPASRPVFSHWGSREPHVTWVGAFFCTKDPSGLLRGPYCKQDIL